MSALPSWYVWKTGNIIFKFYTFVTTAVSYQWMKGTSFLIQALNSYFFLSADGNLYFSEVQQNDEGNYHCIVTLKAFPGDTLATDQPPTETSLDIKLDVLGDSKYFVDFSSQCSRFLRTGPLLQMIHWYSLKINKFQRLLSTRRRYTMISRQCFRNHQDWVRK